jgi:hypothetical protein
VRIDVPLPPASTFGKWVREPNIGARAQHPLCSYAVAHGASIARVVVVLLQCHVRSRPLTSLCIGDRAVLFCHSAERAVWHMHEPFTRRVVLGSGLALGLLCISGGMWLVRAAVRAQKEYDALTRGGAAGAAAGEPPRAGRESEALGGGDRRQTMEQGLSGGSADVVKDGPDKKDD